MERGRKKKEATYFETISTLFISIVKIFVLDHFNTRTTTTTTTTKVIIQVQNSLERP